MATDRIRAGLVAFCAGDALGVPWEGRPSTEVDADRLDSLPARNGWPRGATSDDTAQMLLVARELVDAGGEPDPERFLDALAHALPTMRGAGRTTRKAVKRWERERTPRAPEGVGATNGAAMRALPIGFATAPGEVTRRRAMVAQITHTTHGDERALAAATAIAAMGSYAATGTPAFSVFAAGVEEAGAITGEARDALTAAAVGRWQPPPEGVPFDSLPTVAAVVSVLCRCNTPGQAMREAVALGGDTDTVAALTGGLVAARTGGLDGVDWLDGVMLPDAAEVDELAHGLRALRA